MGRGFGTVCVGRRSAGQLSFSQPRSFAFPSVGYRYRFVVHPPVHCLGSMEHVKVQTVLNFKDGVPDRLGALRQPMLYFGHPVRILGTDGFE